MVLSNKKLKQKLRSLLAVSISAAESNTKTPSSSSPPPSSSSAPVKKEVEAIRELLSSKPNLPKSQRRKNKKPPPPPLSEEAKEEDQKGKEENKEKKIKNRKREGGNENGVSIEEEEEGEKKKKSEKKKPYKKKKKKDEVKEGSIEEEEKASDKAAVVEVPIKIDESEVKKVYVGGIPYYSTEDDIRSFFEGCGTVTEVDCMRFPETGKFRGIAILTFKTEAAAKRALALDGADMGGFYLKIQPYKASRIQKPKSEFAPEVVEGYNRAYVGNLSWDITEDDLKKLFLDCKVSSIRFGMDKVTGEFKGYAHVDFSDTVSLSIALKLDQKIVSGRPARISCAVPKAGGTTKWNKNPSKIPDGVKGEDGQSKNHDGDKGEYGQSNNHDGDKGVYGQIKNTDGNKDEYGQSEYLDSSTTEVSQSRGTKKKKRRTCYECGIPGHLSSECPQKKGG